MNNKQQHNTSKNEKISYPVFQQRLSQDNINWLRKENKNYDTWNKFFNQLILSYGKRNK